MNLWSQKHGILLDRKSNLRLFYLSIPKIQSETPKFIKFMYKNTMFSRKFGFSKSGWFPAGYFTGCKSSFWNWPGNSPGVNQVFSTQNWPGNFLPGRTRVPGRTPYLITFRQKSILDSRSYFRFQNGKWFFRKMESDFLPARSNSGTLRPRAPSGPSPSGCPRPRSLWL